MLISYQSSSRQGKGNENYIFRRRKDKKAGKIYKYREILDWAVSTAPFFLKNISELNNF